MKDGGGNIVRWGHCSGPIASLDAGDRIGYFNWQANISGESDLQGRDLGQQDGRAARRAHSRPQPSLHRDLGGQQHRRLARAHEADEAARPAVGLDRAAAFRQPRAVPPADAGRAGLLDGDGRLEGLHPDRQGAPRGRVLPARSRPRPLGQTIPPHRRTRRPGGTRRPGTGRPRTRRWPAS